jgi:DNA repair photolyase
MTDLDRFSETGGPGSSLCYKRLTARTALSPSQLPGLDYALNPYVGCAHDCVYCYAPTVLNADRLKWGTDIGARTNLPNLLAKEVRNRKGMIGLGTVTDPYQPIERELLLTRKCLEVLVRADHPLSVLTKSPLVTRDIDLLKGISRVEVGLTITGQDDGLARAFEPGAPPPSERLSAVRRLSEEGIDTYVMIGPVIPGVSDMDIEAFLATIAATGVKRVMLDRMRLRPGLMEKFHALPVMTPEFRHNFDRGVSSMDFFRAFSEQTGHLCSKLGLRLEQAF